MLTFPTHVLVFAEDESASSCVRALEAEGVAALIRRVWIWVHGQPLYRGNVRVQRRFRLDVPDAASPVSRIDPSRRPEGLVRIVSWKRHERVEAPKVVFIGTRGQQAAKSIETRPRTEKNRIRGG